MTRFIHKASKKAGLSPGALVHVGEKTVDQVKIRVIRYDEAGLEEKEAKTIDEGFPDGARTGVTWIDIVGLHDMGIMEAAGMRFNLHPLTLEDILNTGQRPKMEEFDGYIFVVLKMLFYDDEENQVRTEQVSVILGSNFVLSFQEREKDVFDPLRERIRKGKGRVRKMGPDYLAYALLDAIVDSYYAILEKVGEQVEQIEEGLVTDPRTETLHTIHQLKREMIFLRKAVWPLREVVGTMERRESDLVSGATEVFLRDLYDHTIQVIDTIETFRDMLSGMLDLYLSSISNRMNEVMKVLTIIATIFIPVTFVAGVYGMNFESMPELKWPWGYAYVWGVMAAIGIVMLFYFRRKKWL